MNVITITKHEASEWSRMATSAYRAELNDIGHRFSMAATYEGYSMHLSMFDSLQRDYRAWLIDGFKTFELSDASADSIAQS